MAKWTSKDKRQYEHIKESQLDDGKSEEKAEEVAARTVNKQRRKEGRTPNKTTQGTGNPNSSLEERTVEELRNLASERNIEGRSEMNKEDLVAALRQSRRRMTFTLLTQSEKEKKMSINTECIEACQRCATACEQCLNAMIDMQSDNDCPHCCRECIDLCLLCAQAMARESRFADEICRICADVCEWCAEQCEAHDHDHCCECAEACRKCVDSCRAMAT